MAVKRNPNDRNATALQKRKKDKQGTWTADDGRLIKLKEKPNLGFIQQAINSVDFPERPTYEVKIGSRVQEYPVDKDVIDQTDDPLEKLALARKWRAYLTDLNDAQQLQARRGTGATFYEGTLPDDGMVESDGAWQKKMRITGWKVPADSEERWVFYLQTSLTDDEVTRLGAAIVRMAGGVSEEEIEAAMDMFRDDLPDGPEQPGVVVEPETDTGDRA